MGVLRPHAKTELRPELLPLWRLCGLSLPGRSIEKQMGRSIPTHIEFGVSFARLMDGGSLGRSRAVLIGLPGAGR